MPIASLNHHPDIMPDLAIRILLADMLFQMVALLERDILDDHDIREGRQVIEYELMPFYRACPRDFRQFDNQPLRWWRELQAVLLAPWVNLRFELLDRQGVWKAMVKAGSLEEHDLHSVYQVAEVTENHDFLAEARLPLINTFDALIDRPFYSPLTILNIGDPLDDQLADQGGFGVPVDFVLDDDQFDLLRPPASREDPEDLEDDLSEVFDEPLVSDDELEQAVKDFGENGDPFAEGQGLADEANLDDLAGLEDEGGALDSERWEHQQDLLLTLSHGSVRTVAAFINESVFQRWQVEILRQVQSWLMNYEAALEAPMEHRENALTRLTMGIHPYIEQEYAKLFYSMHVQMAALAIISNGDLEPFDEVDRQQRGDRLLEVIDDAMFLRMLGHMGGPVYRMGVTEVDPSLIAQGGVTRH